MAFGNRSGLLPVGVLLCPRIHDVIPLPANKSCALRAAREPTRGASSSPEDVLRYAVEGWVPCRLVGVLGVVLSRVFLWLAVWVVGFVVGDVVGVRGACSNSTFFRFSLSG